MGWLTGRTRLLVIGTFCLLVLVLLVYRYKQAHRGSSQQFHQHLNIPMGISYKDRNSPGDAPKQDRMGFAKKKDNPWEWNKADGHKDSSFEDQKKMEKHKDSLPPQVDSEHKLKPPGKDTIKQRIGDALEKLKKPKVNTRKPAPKVGGGAPQKVGGVWGQQKLKSNLVDQMGERILNRPAQQQQNPGAANQQRSYQSKNAQPGSIGGQQKFQAPWAKGTKSPKNQFPVGAGNQQRPAQQGGAWGAQRQYQQNNDQLQQVMGGAKVGGANKQWQQLPPLQQAMGGAQVGGARNQMNAQQQQALQQVMGRANAGGYQQNGANGPFQQGNRAGALPGSFQRNGAPLGNNAPLQQGNRARAQPGSFQGNNAPFQQGGGRLGAQPGSFQGNNQQGDRVGAQPGSFQQNNPPFQQVGARRQNQQNSNRQAQDHELVEQLGRLMNDKQNKAGRISGGSNNKNQYQMDDSARAYLEDKRAFGEDQKRFAKRRAGVEAAAAQPH